MLTFLPLEQIAELEKLEGQELNEAKKILAYELTKTVHGKDEADKAKSGAEAVFGGSSDMSNMPSSTVSPEDIGEQIAILDLLTSVSLIPSKAEGRRLIQQGGLSVNGEKITDTSFAVTADMLSGDGIVIKKGKKVFHRISF